MRVEYQHRLEGLESSLHEQGELCLRAIRGTLDALEAQDAELCDEVIAFDDEIDMRYHRIEKLVEEILALETPVAGDLRLVLAVLHDSIHLERVGDQAVTIAKLTKLTAELETRHDVVEGLREMGDRCVEMVTIALDSFGPSVSAISWLELPERISSAQSLTWPLRRLIWSLIWLRFDHRNTLAPTTAAAVVAAAIGRSRAVSIHPLY